ncbi:hypothetical protein G7054_g940 [Neopestalotiopsis clavispora]|nr:hypothetical protein G7054_g940 [Neopestalotiopsis clavispora]
MDHIALPCDDIAPCPLETLYMEHHHVGYEDYGMHAYLGRRGFDKKLPPKGSEPRMRLSEAAQIVHPWLWLCFIGDWSGIAILSMNALRHNGHDVFTKKNKNGDMTALGKVGKVIQLGQEWVLSLSSDEQTRRLMSHTELTHTFAQQRVITLHASGVELDKRQPPIPVFLILMNAQVFLHIFLRSIRGLTNSVARSTVAAYNDCARLVGLLLSRSSWYQHEVNTLLQDITLRYHLACRRRTSCYYQHVSWFNHEETCDKHSIMQAAYITPKHTHQQCFCPPVSAPTTHSMLRAADQHVKLYTYRTGLLRCESLGSEEKSMHTKTKIDFVAISHVRSLGLGNDRGNFLPQCQLSRLQTLANKIISPVHKTSDTPFWIDALGIPIDPELRKIALRSLQNIFTQATTVLVLDPTLSTHPFSQAEEAITSIRYSLWKSRLWTLEEGFYAKKLVFCFCNSLVSLEDILQKVCPSPIVPVSITNNVQSKLNIPETRVLKAMLSKFSSDIHMAGQLGLPIDRNCLYRALRAGYLLSERFSLLIEQSEVELQRKVIPEIFTIYGSEERFCDTAVGVAKRLNKIDYCIQAYEAGNNEGN